MKVVSIEKNIKCNKGGFTVKKYFARYLMLSVLMLALTGMVSSAYAGYFWPPGDPNPGRGGNRSVPEPATLALVGAGIVGVGVYFYVKRKNKK
jgi:hypothetical protein